MGDRRSGVADSGRNVSTVRMESCRPSARGCLRNSRVEASIPVQVLDDEQDRPPRVRQRCTLQLEEHGLERLLLPPLPGSSRATDTRRKRSGVVGSDSSNDAQSGTVFRRRPGRTPPGGGASGRTARPSPRRLDSRPKPRKCRSKKSMDRIARRCSGVRLAQHSMTWRVHLSFEAIRTRTCSFSVCTRPRLAQARLADQEDDLAHGFASGLAPSRPCSRLDLVVAAGEWREAQPARRLQSGTRVRCRGDSPYPEQFGGLRAGLERCRELSRHSCGPGATGGWAPGADDRDRPWPRLA